MIAEIIFIPIVILGTVLAKSQEVYNIPMSLIFLWKILSPIVSITILPATMIRLFLFSILPSLLAEIGWWIVVLINYFILGAIIGFIIGKIKSRNK